MQGTRFSNPATLRNRPALRASGRVQRMAPADRVRLGATLAAVVLAAVSTALVVASAVMGWAAR